MNFKYFHIALAIWIFAVASIFAESFPNRPTAGELEGIVVTGKECMLGVNERCLATQYSTNPVQYHVTPPFVKTNYVGWHLQNNMGSMASTIRSLAPYYADTNTVYDGTTNITMLVVTSLWAQLAIGDHTNKFTGTPASGTNSATYGDYPWRIYATNLEERYKVLNTLKICRYSYTVGITNLKTLGAAPIDSPNYASALSAFQTANWDQDWISGRVEANLDNHPPIDGGWTLWRSRLKYSISEKFFTTNVSYNSVNIKVQVDELPYGSGSVSSYFWTANEYGIYKEYVDVVSLTSPETDVFPFTSDYIGNSTAPVPNPGYSGYKFCYGFALNGPQVYIDWNFQYCTDE